MASADREQRTVSQFVRLLLSDILAIIGDADAREIPAPSLVIEDGGAPGGTPPDGDYWAAASASA